jgi:uncharacterized membrane protein SpoIIM required for sporulation/uncharacterized RDD family membrane protein YckC
MNAARPSAPGFSRRISVETPEHIVLHFELAGLGARAAAAIIDVLLLAALLFTISLVVLAAIRLESQGGVWIVAILLFAYFLVIWGYYALFEGLAGGRTPGKRRTGIRVVMDTGHPITFAAAAARNLVRIVDIQPVMSYGVGVVFVLLHPHHKRLGDLVAGTIVVRDRPADLAPAAASAPAIEERIDAGPPVLSDDEFRLLGQLLARLDDLEGDVRSRFVIQMANRFADRVPDRDFDLEVFLADLHESEMEKRRARTTLRRDARGGKASGTAERFAALKQAGWERFRERAAALERKGLAQLTGDELTRFAAEYREVAADLARARTYGVDARVLAYLERAVGTGHNALYGLRGVKRVPLGRLLFDELPGAVYGARGYVLAAALLFFIPGVVGYLLLREQPDIAYEVIPDEMIARAESGQDAQIEGRGYAETPSPFLPLVASGIIANNVQVAFGAFAFGITAGIGTVVLLVFNGLFFGSVLGLFANYELSGWILTFVAGHGVLELTAIFIAGGAGLVIARALIAPGDLARLDALVMHGRAAVRMVGAAALLLVLAGLIEGFLSASAAPATLKMGVSVASAFLVLLLYAAGRRSATVS